MLGDNWVHSAITQGIGGVQVGAESTQYSTYTAMEELTTHNKLYTVLVANIPRSMKLNYLERMSKSNKCGGYVTKYVITQLAKDELINKDNSINEELAKTGIPQWKKDWYNE